jgi:hypothetical protein
MEDIPDVYTGKYDKNCILICMDEISRQMIGKMREPFPAGCGRLKKLITVDFPHAKKSFWLWVISIPWSVGRAEACPQRRPAWGENRMDRS